MGIEIKKAELRDAHFQAYDAKKVVKLEYFLLSSSFIKQRFAIDYIELKSDLANLKGKLVVNDLFDQLDQENITNKITGDVKWAITLPNENHTNKNLSDKETANVSPINGTTNIKGTFNYLRLNTQLSSPYQSVINLNIKDPLEDVQIQLQGDIQNINLANINAKWPAYQLAGIVNANGNIDNYRVDSRLDFINQELEKDKTKEKIIKGNLAVNIQGDAKKIVFPLITLSGDAGSLSGKGELSIKPHLQVTLDISGQDINPGVFANKWPGKLNIDVTVNTNNVSDKTKNTSVVNSKIKISGSLRNHPVLLDANVLYGEDDLQLKKMMYRSGKSNISASAGFKNNKNLSLIWEINSNNLQELMPDIKGKFNGKGSVESISFVDNPFMTKLQANVKVSDMSIADIEINSLNSEVNIDWRNGKKIAKNNAINIDSKNIKIGSNTIEKLSINFDGLPEDHQIYIKADSNQGKLETDLKGSLIKLSSQKEWQFDIVSANVLPPNSLAPWILDKGASGVVSINNQQLNNHCWKSDSATLCFDVDHQKLTKHSAGSKIQSTFSVASLPISYFSSLFPNGVAWTDTVINGEGQLILSSLDDVDVSMSIDTTQGKLSWANTKNSGLNNNAQGKAINQSIVLQPGKLRINSNNPVVKADGKQIKKSINTSLILPIDNDKGIEASVSLFHEKKSFVNRPVNGQLLLQLNDLSFLESFVSDASDVKGAIAGQWAITGSIAKPIIDGKLSLSDTQLRLNTPGILLEKVNAELIGDKQKGIIYQASAYSANGQINLDGTINKLFEKAPEVNLKITGNDFEAINTDEANVFISPNINVTTNRHKIDVQGELRIPKATITPKRIPASVVSVSEDQIIIDQDTTTTNKALSQEIVAKLNVILGDEVAIDGFGFKGKAAGNIQLMKTAKDPTIANGKVRITDGEYRAFGQGLVIDKGLVLFSGGPIAKPGIDIKALRRPAEGITVGVFARGSISKPTVTIFSEPAMNQSEQLSWLVLGRPLENSSEGENNAINQLLLSMSLGKTDSVLNRLGDTLNLDSVGIQTGSGEAGAASDNDLAELVLGKYLSPELYISYGIGLFKPVNVLSLEYSLSRAWKLKTETSSEASGGDLIYSIER